MHRITTKIAVVGLLALASVGGLQGQATAAGVRLGVNFATVSSTEFGQGVGRRTGLAAGAFVAFSQTGRLVVQPEFLYSRKGFASRVQGGTAHVNLSYAEIPLLFKIRVSDQSRRLRPAILLGSFVAFEVGCSLSGATEGIGGGSDCAALVPGRGKMDAGFLLGAGVDYGLVDRFFLTADIRYARGLMNLEWEETLDRVTSRAWMLMLGAGVLLDR